MNIWYEYLMSLISVLDLAFKFIEFIAWFILKIEMCKTLQNGNW